MSFHFRRCFVAMFATLALSNLAFSQIRYVDDSAPLGGDGLSWATAFQDLQDALAAASGDPSIQELWVAEGRYIPDAGGNINVSFELQDNLALYGGFAGNETSRDQRDPALRPTILDGDLNGDDLPGFVNYTDNSRHVVRASFVDETAVLDGFVVRGGNYSPGAGIRCDSATPTLRTLVIRENSGLGGSNEGGGLFASLNQGRQMIVEDCRFLDNRSTLGGGASFEANFGGSVFVHRCSFTDHVATTGSGVSFDGAWLDESPLYVEITDSSFTGNHATAGASVSLHSEDVTTLVVRDSTFFNNPHCSGGGIFSISEVGNQITVERCTFANNAHHDSCGIGSGGGGIRALSGTVDVLECTFLDNEEGHLFLERNAQATLRRSTLQQNISDRGLTLLTGSFAELTDCIVWGSNSFQIGGDALVNATATYSDVHMNGGGLPGVGNIDVDPLFVNPGAGDLHLTAGSPCVDTASPHPVPPPIGADFERDSRTVDGDLDGTVRLDMGSDEFGPIHLEVQGVPSIGNPLLFVTTGTPGLAALLVFGIPGTLYSPSLGTLFIDLSLSPRLILSWPSTPSVVQVIVPPGVPSDLFHVQEIGLGGGGVIVLSNYFPLEFQ